MYMYVYTHIFFFFFFLNTQFPTELLTHENVTITVDVFPGLLGSGSHESRREEIC